MRLASLRSGGRDGRLMLVSRDRSRMVPAEAAATLQTALESWPDSEPALRAQAEALESDGLPAAEAYEADRLAAPLPRAHQFLDGSAYLYHVELVRRARGAEMPPSLYDDPLMYQAVSDGFLAPREDIVAASEDWGIDFEAEICVVLDDVPCGITPEAAAGHIRLLMLVNDVSLRNLIPGELAKGFGFLHGKPRSAFAPLAVTPDDLGAAWDGGKLHLPVRVTLNGEPFGQPNAGVDMQFDFPRLIAHAARSRPLAAGTIIGSGTVANRDPASGSCCLAEKRMVETIEEGAPRTEFLHFGDEVTIEVFDQTGLSIFGAIRQKVSPGP